MTDFWKDKIVKCKKNHHCASCQRTIVKDQYAHYQAGTSDGDFQAYYLCHFCYTIERELIKNSEHNNDFLLVYQIIELAMDDGIIDRYNQCSICGETTHLISRKLPCDCENNKELFFIEIPCLDEIFTSELEFQKFINEYNSKFINKKELI